MIDCEMCSDESKGNAGTVHSCLDYVLASPRILPFVTGLSVEMSWARECNSDHAIILTHFDWAGWNDAELLLPRGKSKRINTLDVGRVTQPQWAEFQIKAEEDLVMKTMAEKAKTVVGFDAKVAIMYEGFKAVREKAMQTFQLQQREGVSITEEEEVSSKLELPLNIARLMQLSKDASDLRHSLVGKGKAKVARKQDQTFVAKAWSHLQDLANDVSSNPSLTAVKSDAHSETRHKREAIARIVGAIAPGPPPPMTTSALRTELVRRIIEYKRQVDRMVGLLEDCEKIASIEAAIRQRDTEEGTKRYFQKLSHKDRSSADHRTATYTENKHGVETTIHERDPDKVKELFSAAAEDLYKERPAEHSEACTRTVSTIERIEGRTYDGLCLKFTHKDLDRALSQTSISSTPGLDNVQGFAVKHPPAWLQTLFLEVSNAVYSCAQKAPPQWLQSQVVNIPKANSPASRDRVDSQRGINLLSVPFKIQERMECNRLMDTFDKHNILHPSQTGGVRGGSTTPQVEMLLDILTHMRETGTEYHLVMHDARRAYDRVSFSGLVASMRSLKLPEKCMSHVHSKFGRVSEGPDQGKWNPKHPRQSAVWTGWGLGRMTDVRASVGQGSVSGPLYYSIFLNNLLIKLNDMAVSEDGCGAVLRESGKEFALGAWAYVDDLVTMSSSLPGQQAMCECIETCFRSTGMALHPKKCQYITNAKEMPAWKRNHCDARWDGHEETQIRWLEFDGEPDRPPGTVSKKVTRVLPLGVNDTWTYLGITGTQAGDWSAQETKTENKGKKVARFYCAKNMTGKQAANMLNVVVLPGVCYVARHADLQEAVFDRVAAASRTALRRAAKLPRTFSNSYIHLDRGGFGLKPLSVEVTGFVSQLALDRINEAFPRTADPQRPTDVFELWPKTRSYSAAVAELEYLRYLREDGPDKASTQPSFGVTLGLSQAARKAAEIDAKKWQSRRTTARHAVVRNRTAQTRVHAGALQEVGLPADPYPGEREGLKECIVRRIRNFSVEGLTPNGVVEFMALDGDANGAPQYRSTDFDRDTGTTSRWNIQLEEKKGADGRRKECWVIGRVQDSSTGDLGANEWREVMSSELRDPTEIQWTPANARVWYRTQEPQSSRQLNRQDDSVAITRVGHTSQGGSTETLPGEWGNGRERAMKRRAPEAPDAIEVFGTHGSAILYALHPGAQLRPENQERNRVEKCNGQRIYYSNPADDLETETVAVYGHGGEDGWMVASVTSEGELDPQARSLRHEELECLGIHPNDGNWTPPMVDEVHNWIPAQDCPVSEEDNAGHQRGSAERRDSAPWPDWAARAQSPNAMAPLSPSSTASAAVKHTDSSQGELFSEDSERSDFSDIDIADVFSQGSQRPEPPPHNHTTGAVENVPGSCGTEPPTPLQLRSRHAPPHPIVSHQPPR